MSEGNEASVEWALEYRRLDATDGVAGNNILFKGARFQPLDYGTLASARLDRPLTIPIDIHGQVQSTDLAVVRGGLGAWQLAPGRGHSRPTVITAERGGCPRIVCRCGSLVCTPMSVGLRGERERAFEVSAHLDGARGTGAWIAA